MATIIKTGNELQYFGRTKAGPSATRSRSFALLGMTTLHWLRRWLRADGFSDPLLNRLPQLVQAACKEMIPALDHDQLLRFRNRRDQRLQFRPRPELVARSADEQLWLWTFAQEVERVSTRFFHFSRKRTNRHSQADECIHPSMWTCGAQSDCRAEGEPREHQRQMKLRVEPVQSDSNIFDFSSPAIVLALAQAGAAEIEAQNRKSEAVQRLHRVEDDLVVQRSAK